MLDSLITVLHVLTCVALVILVLMQQGKGADIGAAFGSGASNTVFGSPGASSFLFKLTAGLATIFFITSLALSSFSTTSLKAKDAFAMPEGIPLPQQQEATSVKTSSETPKTGSEVELPAPLSSQPGIKKQK